MDATIIETACGGKNKAGESTRDRVATHMFKHGWPHHGFEASANTSIDGFMTDDLFDTAKMHDFEHIDDLVKDDKKAVYADSAYMTKARSEAG